MGHRVVPPTFHNIRVYAISFRRLGNFSKKVLVSREYLVPHFRLTFCRILLLLSFQKIYFHGVSIKILRATPPQKHHWFTLAPETGVLQPAVCIRRTPIRNGQNDTALFCFDSSVYSLEFPKSQELDAGKNTTLKCAADGYPYPTFKWYKNFKRIDLRNPRYTLLKNGSLALTNVREDDAGNYTCLITQLGEVERQREERKDIQVVVFGGCTGILDSVVIDDDDEDVSGDAVRVTIARTTATATTTGGSTDTVAISDNVVIDDDEDVSGDDDDSDDDDVHVAVVEMAKAICWSQFKTEIDIQNSLPWKERNVLQAAKRPRKPFHDRHFDRPTIADTNLHCMLSSPTHTNYTWQFTSFRD